MRGHRSPRRRPGEPWGVLGLAWILALRWLGSPPGGASGFSSPSWRPHRSCGGQSKLGDGLFRPGIATAASSRVLPSKLRLSAVSGPKTVKSSPRIALLIDGDQVGPRVFRPLLDAVRARGHLVLCRLYAQDNDLKKWRDTLQALKIDPVTVRRTQGGAKDLNDIVIALDAAELASSTLISRDPSLQACNISGIALASEDSDFLHILQRVRAWGLSAYWLVPESPGTGCRLHISTAASKADVQLVRYSSGKPTKSATVALILTRGNSSIEMQGAPMAPKLLETSRMQQLSRLLVRLGYLSAARADDGGIGPAAIAKFFHANDLGPLMVFPRWRCIEQALEAVEMSPDERWIPDPGNLVYIEPAGGIGGKDKADKLGSTTAARLVSGGGPFILEDSPDLVRQVLERLGYLNVEGVGVHEVLDAALECFCRRNRQLLKKAGIATEGLGASELHKLLRDAFIAPPSLHPEWKRIFGDADIRRRLRDERRLSRVGASQKEVRLAIKKYLEERGVSGGTSSYYWACVEDCLMHTRLRRDPNWRK